MTVGLRDWSAVRRDLSNVSSVKSDVVSLRRMPLCNRVSNSVEVTFPCLHHPPPPSPPLVLKSADGRAGEIGLCANQSILVVETCGTFDFPGSAGGVWRPRRVVGFADLVIKILG